MNFVWQNAPYSSIPLAILKVLMMMVGEVNYEDLFYGNEENPVDDLLYPVCIFRIGHKNA